MYTTNYTVRNGRTGYKTQSCKNCSRVCVPLRTTVVHNTTQNSSDNLPSYPPSNRHISDDATGVQGAFLLLTNST